MSMTKIWATLFMEDLWQFHHPTANQANQTPIFCVNLGFCGRHNLPFGVSRQKFCPESVHHLVVWTSLAADQILLWMKYLQSLSHKIANCLIFWPFPPSLYQHPFWSWLKWDFENNCGCKFYRDGIYQRNALWCWGLGVGDGRLLLCWADRRTVRVLKVPFHSAPQSRWQN